MTKEQEESGFRITDKRLFREDGELREDTRTAESPQEKKSESFKAVGEAGPGVQQPPGSGVPIDFPSYILSYYTQGLVFLGEAPNPFTNKQEQDLESSRHMIDILTMLQRVFFGPVQEPATEGPPARDLNGREWAALLPLGVLCLVIGVWPQPLLDVARRDVAVVTHITDQARQRAEGNPPVQTASRGGDRSRP